MAPVSPLTAAKSCPTGDLAEVIKAQWGQRGVNGCGQVEAMTAALFCNILNVMRSLIWSCLSLWRPFVRNISEMTTVVFFLLSKREHCHSSTGRCGGLTPVHPKEALSGKPSRILNFTAHPVNGNVWECWNKLRAKAAPVETLTSACWSSPEHPGFSGFQTVAWLQLHQEMAKLSATLAFLRSLISYLLRRERTNMLPTTL